MAKFEKTIDILEEHFGGDYIYVFATSNDNIPSTRVVDAYYDNGAFWIVTYGTTRKVKELEKNPNVSLCNNFHVFNGKAYNVGHPLDESNKKIREKLIKVFEPWYFAHNNEEDKDMCYVKIEPETGFFHKDKSGYRIDFVNKKVEEIPFTPDCDKMTP